MAVNEIEIKNFTLQYDGMYAIETETREQFRIHLSPYDLLQLFQKEGYKTDDIIEIWSENNKIPFTKTVLKMFNFMEDDKIIARCSTECAEYYDNKGIEVHYVEIE
jgi:hypothetical protein